MILMPTTFSTQPWRLRNGIFASLILSFFITLSACEDPQEIGSEVFAQNIGVLYTDTLTVEASTILLDSIVTGASQNLLVGRTIDPELGAVEAVSYFQMTPFDTLRSFVDTAGRKKIRWIRYPSKVDSIRLYLPYTSYEGDTNQRQSFKFYQLSQNASMDVANLYQNKTDGPSLKTTTLGQVLNARIRPIRNSNILSGSGRFDTLKIPITEPAFIKYIASQRDLVRKDSVEIGFQFRKTTRGFGLVSESAKNAAILGFGATTSYMKVFYSYKYTYTILNKAGTADSATATVDTTKANFILVYDVDAQSNRPLLQNARFNKITTARTGNLAKLVKVTDALPAKLSNNEAYIQCAAGLVMKVKFPSLSKLKAGQDVAINKAELVLEPNANPNNFTLPQDLVFAESTKDNRLLRTTNDGSGIIDFVTRTESYIGSYQNRTNNYTFNVTSALQNILSGRNLTNGWIITPTILTTTSQGQRGFVSAKNILTSDVTRAVFNTKNIKLKVYYTYVAK